MLDFHLLLFLALQSLALSLLAPRSSLALSALAFQSRLAGYLFLRWCPAPSALQIALIAFLLYALGLSRSQLPLRPLRPAPAHLLSNLLKSLLGLTTDSRPFNLFSLALNALVLLFCLHSALTPLFYYPHSHLAFSRVGAVAESWVKIHVRIPPTPPAPLLAGPRTDLEPVDSPAPSNLTGARLFYRPLQPIVDWIPGPDLLTSPLNDFTAVGRIVGLWPGVSYEYRLVSLGSSSDHHPLFPVVGHFKTAPDSSLLSTDQLNRGSFKFAYSSCIKPGFPYNPFRDPLHNDGADQLADYAIENNLDFVMFLGDFIYADSPLYRGPSIHHYHQKYRQTFSTRGWKQLIRSTSTLHIYDDHEILNDWAGEGNVMNEVFFSANKAYRDYLGDANHDGPTPSGDNEEKEAQKENYYWFRYGDAAFFVWDCRKFRSRNQDLDDERKSMLGVEQKRVFLSWLEAVNSTVTFKFVISSTPFMTLWSGLDGAMDTWAGFVTERTELMDVMEYVPNVIVLSGDRHEFAAATIRETVTEFSTSPLNQFWLPIKTLSQENGLGKVGIEEDRLLKYIPSGNHKFGSLSVDSRDAKRPVVKFELLVDGRVAWNLTYLGRPVVSKKERLLGSGLDAGEGEGRGVGDHLMMGWEEFLLFLKPVRWF